MNKIKIIFVLSIWMTILSFLGFPLMLKNIIFLISGFILTFISYLLYREMRKGEEQDKFDNFSENSDFVEKEKKIEEVVQGENLNQF